MKFESKYGHNDVVTLVIDTTKIRWCSITVVKFEENMVKYDIKTPSGQKLYDIPEVSLEEPSHDAIKTEG